MNYRRVRSEALEKSILQSLDHSPKTAKQISLDIGYNRHYVNTKMKELKTFDLVEWKKVRKFVGGRTYYEYIFWK